MIRHVVNEGPELISIPLWNQPHDAISQCKAGWPMRNQQHRARPQHIAAILKEMLFRLGVEHCGSFIKDENFRVFQQRSRQGDSLALPP